MEPPHISPSISASALERYLANEASAAEIQQVEAWIAASPVRAAAVDRLRRVRTSVPITVDESDAAWSHLAERIAEASDGVGSRSARSSAATRRRLSMLSGSRPLRTAGVAIMGAAAALLFVTVARPHRAPDALTGLLYATTAGQRATVRLPDGTRVTLAPNASLRLNRDFGGDTRTAALTGEAYFEVAPASSSPFIVETGAVRTRVLGTSFDVRSAEAIPGTPASQTVQVAVTSGRVEMLGTPRGAHPQSVVLSAGMVGVVTDSSVEATTVSNVADYSAWINGQLVFRETPVSQVLATLERWYGFQFRLNDTTLAQQHLTTRFANESASDMLNALAQLLDVTMTFDGNVITLRPRGGDARPHGAQAGTKTKSLIHSSNEVGR